MEHHFEHTPFEGKREQTERALLQKFVLLYATLGRDAGSAQHTTPDGLGKTILEAARDKDELSLKVKLLDSWAIMIANGSGIEVPKGKVQSLSRLLASLTDLEKAAEHMIPTLKSLSLRSDEFAKTMAEKYMSEIAVKARSSSLGLDQAHSGSIKLTRARSSSLRLGNDQNLGASGCSRSAPLRFGADPDSGPDSTPPTAYSLLPKQQQLYASIHNHSPWRINMETQ
ncbi:hypothetical protein G7Y89_g7404 [Cudoniella acicularis]|uniref:Uncharacterized protein n=1 Tax=Cudoniella acicularis TaxID=354080 RepID=A0A8H4W4L1_9HELO|nr:hypothetical protein G7Y89_g7404 [Cudoniella acicularis]